MCGLRTRRAGGAAWAMWLSADTVPDRGRAGCGGDPDRPERPRVGWPAVPRRGSNVANVCRATCVRNYDE